MWASASLVLVVLYVVIFERYTSHRMAFQGLYGLRVWFYAHLEPLAPAILKRFGAGDMLGRIMGI